MQDQRGLPKNRLDQVYTMDTTILFKWARSIIKSAIEYPELRSSYYVHYEPDTTFSLDLDDNNVSVVEDGKITIHSLRDAFRGLFPSRSDEKKLTVFNIHRPNITYVVKYHGNLHAKEVVFLDCGFTYNGKIYVFYPNSEGGPVECLPCIIPLHDDIIVLDVKVNYRLALLAAHKVASEEEESVSLGDLTFTKSEEGGKVVITDGDGEITVVGRNLA